jgi:hypothetical protein
MIITFEGSPTEILEEWIKIVETKDWCFDDKQGAILDVKDRMNMSAKKVTVRVGYNV